MREKRKSRARFPDFVRGVLVGAILLATGCPQKGAPTTLYRYQEKAKHNIPEFDIKIHDAGSAEMSGGPTEVIPVGMKANNKPAGTERQLKDHPTCAVDSETTSIQCTFFLGDGPKFKKLKKSDFQKIG